MKYMGSKSRIAKYIVPIIQKAIDDSGYKIYIEPFGGGMNVIDKIVGVKRYGCDLNKYLISLFEHLQRGESLPDEVSRETYSSIRSNPDQFEDWMVGCVGFLASYNGRFFDGGYAQHGYEKTKSGERYRNYYREAKDNILAQMPDLLDVKFVVRNYLDINPSGAVIYCDPPYAGTKQYKNATQFNHEQFWDVMRRWSQDNIVFISEENAPEDFECIWSQEVSRSIKATDKSTSVERLYKYKCDETKISYG